MATLEGMTVEMPHAVREKHNQKLIAVFSNEGLAQTHAAKLKLIDTNYMSPQLEVVPLVMDELTKLEPRYYATYTATTQEPELIEAEIQSGCDTLATELHAPEVDTADPDYVAFVTSGWSEEAAIAELVQLVEAHVDLWYAEHDPTGELYG